MTPGRRPAYPRFRVLAAVAAVAAADALAALTSLAAPGRSAGLPFALRQGSWLTGAGFPDPAWRPVGGRAGILMPIARAAAGSPLSRRHVRVAGDQFGRVPGVGEPGGVPGGHSVERGATDLVD
jgi:hypothetical protein